jgi:hypothetical protein
VVIDPRPGGFDDVGGTIDVSGGAGGAGAGNGFAGVINIVPEPASLVLLATALPVVAYAPRRRRKPR